MELNQYDIVLVNLNSTQGCEINKTRPYVIVSPNEMNNNLRTITVAPMTTLSRNYPSRVKIKHNNKIGWIVLDQIRTIDKTRIIKKLGSLSEKEILECKSIIKEMFMD